MRPLGWCMLHFWQQSSYRRNTKSDMKMPLFYQLLYYMYNRLDSLYSWMPQQQNMSHLYTVFGNMRPPQHNNPQMPGSDWLHQPQHSNQQMSWYMQMTQLILYCRYNIHMNMPYGHLYCHNKPLFHLGNIHQPHMLPDLNSQSQHNYQRLWSNNNYFVLLCQPNWCNLLDMLNNWTHPQQTIDPQNTVFGNMRPPQHNNQQTPWSDRLHQPQHSNQQMFLYTQMTQMILYCRYNIHKNMPYGHLYCHNKPLFHLGNIHQPHMLPDLNSQSQHNYQRLWSNNNYFVLLCQPNWCNLLDMLNNWTHPQQTIYPQNTVCAPAHCLISNMFHQHTHILLNNLNNQPHLLTNNIQPNTSISLL